MATKDKLLTEVTKLLSLQNYSAFFLVSILVLRLFRLIAMTIFFSVTQSCNAPMHLSKWLVTPHPLYRKL